MLEDQATCDICISRRYAEAGVSRPNIQSFLSNWVTIVMTAVGNLLTVKGAHTTRDLFSGIVLEG